MDDYIDDVDMINVVERLIKREQVTRDRQNPCLNYYEDEFIDRYSLHKECCKDARTKSNPECWKWLKKNINRK
jgi:hypothetical protein